MLNGDKRAAGVFERLFTRLAAARLRQELSRFDDQTLAGFGFKRSEIPHRAARAADEAADIDWGGMFAAAGKAVGKAIGKATRKGWQRWYTRRVLASLDDATLADIGVKRSDIPGIATHGWRYRATFESVPASAVTADFGGRLVKPAAAIGDSAANRPDSLAA